MKKKLVCMALLGVIVLAMLSCGKSGKAGQTSQETKTEDKASDQTGKKSESKGKENKKAEDGTKKKDTASGRKNRHQDIDDVLQAKAESLSKKYGQANTSLYIPYKNLQVLDAIETYPEPEGMKEGIIASRLIDLDGDGENELITLRQKREEGTQYQYIELGCWHYILQVYDIGPDGASDPVASQEMQIFRQLNEEYDYSEYFDDDLDTHIFFLNAGSEQAVIGVYQHNRDYTIADGIVTRIGVYHYNAQGEFACLDEVSEAGSYFEDGYRPTDLMKAATEAGLTETVKEWNKDDFNFYDTEWLGTDPVDEWVHIEARSNADDGFFTYYPDMSVPQNAVGQKLGDYAVSGEIRVYAGAD